MININQSFISAGGNRHPNAADWKDGVLAFGSGHNVAIWNALHNNDAGVDALLRGHTDDVNAVRLLQHAQHARPRVLSGAADKTVRLWTWQTNRYLSSAIAPHDGSVNSIAVLQDSGVFATGCADGTVHIWSVQDRPGKGDMADDYKTFQTYEVGIELRSLQVITLRPRFLPLATALTRLDDGTLVLAVAGTTKITQLYIQIGQEFQLAASLTGHEGWLRSLDFTRESSENGSDILLASASQDKYIRLWRLHKGRELPSTSTASQDPSLGVLGKSLSNKPHLIGEGDSSYSVTFEALLIGSEDWIYTGQWRLSETGPELLTTSADNSVSVWKRQADSGYWICETRLGEISLQKGSTTATGSAGGFWIGLWSPDGSSIVSLGRTGSWRMWSRDDVSNSWQPRFGVSGHVKEVKSVAWSSDGSYLLSTGSDQTTRLLSQWKRGGRTTWHELARPQIHGYDLNCVDTLSPRQFISGADEKLLRVFNMPRASARLMGSLAGESDVSIDDLPDSANIPVLGLSNKAVTSGGADEGEEAQDGVDQEKDIKAEIALDQPPLEDVLARHTLWPEHEKLYGHGYEISMVTASHDHKLVATACRASSIDHAVIRLYETGDWREIRPPLSGHTLTVTSLAFSPDDTRLLSVGRDRQWMVYKKEPGESPEFELHSSNPKGHSRMILDCSWAPAAFGDVFATAGRDKTVKIWHKGEADPDYSCKLTIPAALPVTAVAFSTRVVSTTHSVLAFGTEEGEVAIVRVDSTKWTVVAQSALPSALRPAGSINALRWRPQQQQQRDDVEMLAVASDDHSVRLYDVQIDYNQE